MNIEASLKREYIITFVFGVVAIFFCSWVQGLALKYIEPSLLEKVPEISNSIDNMLVYNFIFCLLVTVFSTIVVSVIYGLSLRQKHMFFYRMFAPLAVVPHLIYTFFFYPDFFMPSVSVLMISVYLSFILVSLIVLFLISRIRKDA